MRIAKSITHNMVAVERISNSFKVHQMRWQPPRRGGRGLELEEMLDKTLAVGTLGLPMGRFKKTYLTAHHNLKLVF